MTGRFFTRMQLEGPRKEFIYTNDSGEIIGIRAVTGRLSIKSNEHMVTKSGLIPGQR
jgi:hypothetical protein